MDRIGRYKIVRELGRGAMGVVYHAIDPNIGRPVAIKTIPLGNERSAQEQDRLRERLFREARSAGILSHPGIVTIYDVEQQGDIAYIAMEFVDGPTLDHVLSGAQPISPGDMFSILGQTAVALDYAHQKGIIHRDIKPANIMIAADGTVKIADFGIAKITSSEQFTMTGSIVGTPHYMSPEQVQGQGVDGRADQFSLGVVAFEMLTGEKPYTGEQLTTVVYKIVAEEPVPPQRLNPSLSGQIDGVIRKVLSKKPETRYRTCQDFIESLEAACTATKGWKTMPRGGSLNAPTVSDPPKGTLNLPPPRKPQRVAGLGDSGTTEVRAERKSSFLTFVLAVMVAAALLALIGWQVAPYLLKPRLPGQTENPPTTTPEPTVAKTTPTKSPTGSRPSPTGPPAAQPPVEKQPVVKPPEPKKAEPPTVVDTPSVEVPKVSKKSVPVETPPKKTTPDGAGGGKKKGRPAENTQPVTIISSPGGAQVVMDGKQSTACKAPCTIEATPGPHLVSVSLPGYQAEHRTVDVGNAPVEMPAIILRAPGGSIMLTSVPSDGTILVDGQATGFKTPHEIRLPPGTHTITVEKDGKQGSWTGAVKTELTTMKMTLQ